MSTIVEASPVTAADLLQRAADLLEEFGWRQGSNGNRADGSMCAVGAIQEAYREKGADLDEYIEALSAFDRAAGAYLTDWNDEPGRTKAEVVAKLRELAM